MKQDVQKADISMPLDQDLSGKVSEDRVIDIELSVEEEEEPDSWLQPAELEFEKEEAAQELAEVAPPAPAEQSEIPEILHAVVALKDAVESARLNEAGEEVIPHIEAITYKVNTIESSLEDLVQFITRPEDETKKETDKTIAALLAALNQNINQAESKILSSIQESPSLDIPLVDPENLDANLETIYNAVNTGVKETRSAIELQDSRFGLLLANLKTLNVRPDIDALIEEVQIATASMNDVATSVGDFKRKVLLLNAALVAGVGGLLGYLIFV